MMPIHDPSTENRLVLDETLDFAHAGPLRTRFCEMRGSDVVVDASLVSHFGAQCAQVLMSAQATWRVDGCRISVETASPAFLEGVRLLGIGHLLNCESSK